MITRGKYISLVIVLLTLPFFLKAQFNIKIGYDGAYAPAPGINQSIEAYNNSSFSILNEPVSAFHWLHGLNMGVRYKYHFLATELSWESLGNSITAIEVDGNNATEKTVYFRMNHLALNQELIFGSLGVGVSAELGLYKMETDLSGTSAKKILSEARPFGSKIYLSFNLKGSDILSFSIKPYYRILWNNGLDTTGLNQYWDNELEGSNELLHHFGIHLCFYNGPQ